MSHKSAKQLRREEKADQEDYVKRRDEFNVEVKKLSAKFRIDLVPIVKWSPQGAVPMIAFVDMKAQYEQMTEEAKKAEALKKAQDTAKKVVDQNAGRDDVVAPAKEDVPKLEL